MVIMLAAMKNWYSLTQRPDPVAQLTSDQLQTYKVPVIGGKDCAKVSQTPTHGSTFSIGSSIKVKALHTPCHTQDSICYLFEDGTDRAVFTGDTLFIGGCGRFFEGNAEEMHTALNKTLSALPDDTRVFVSRLSSREYPEPLPLITD